VAKLGCSTRLFVILALVVFVLLIIGVLSGPIGDAGILPDDLLPGKPMSEEGVTVEEKDVPAGLPSISFDELVARAKAGEVEEIIQDKKDEQRLGIILKDNASATLTATFAGDDLVKELKAQGVEAEEKRSPLAPEEFFSLFGCFSLTNTILAAWFTIIVLLSLAYLATRKMKEVPTGLQNVMEAVVEVMLNFVKGVAGEKNGRRFFPIVASIFLFVIMNAWLSLLPIFNSITYGGDALLRGANTDINVPLAIALVSFCSVEYWGITSMGFRIYMSKFIRLASLRKGKIFTGLVEAFVGVLEAISEGIRIISFTFRLFGNMTAGEILLLVSAYLIPFVFATVFYGLELFIGLVQALIFAGLTLVFASTAVTRHGEEESRTQAKP